MIYVFLSCISLYSKGKEEQKVSFRPTKSAYLLPPPEYTTIRSAQRPLSQVGVVYVGQSSQRSLAQWLHGNTAISPLVNAIESIFSCLFDIFVQIYLYFGGGCQLFELLAMAYVIPNYFASFPQNAAVLLLKDSHVVQFPHVCFPYLLNIKRIYDIPVQVLLK